MKRVIRKAAPLLALVASAGIAGSALGANKLVVGVALPRAQLGQGNGASADVAEPVRQALLAYLKGPALEVVPLEARIPVQITAEAREKGCAFVLYTDITRTQKGSGLGMLKKLAPLAAAVPMLGGAGGGQMAATMAAQTMMSAQMQSAQEDAMANAMAAINGAQKNVVKAGDSLTLEYTLVRPDDTTPTKADKVVGKAKENGQDVLSPLIESVAVAVVDSVAGH